MIFFMVWDGSDHHVVIVNAADREIAKAKAFAFLGGHPDGYTVNPLTPANARVYLDITVN